MSLFQIAKPTQNLLDFRNNCFWFLNLTNSTTHLQTEQLYNGIMKSLKTGLIIAQWTSGNYCEISSLPDAQ